MTALEKAAADDVRPVSRSAPATRKHTSSRLRPLTLAKDAGESKTCRTCKRDLPLSAFIKNHARCKECFREAVSAKRTTISPEKRNEQRQYNATRYRTEHGKAAHKRAIRKYLYGLTDDAHAQLMLSQGGACAGCKVPFEGAKETIDHDHSTGKVRGLLCRTCNIALGMAKDSPRVLRQLAVYLETTKEQP